MIDLKTRLENKLLPCVYTDKKDSTFFKINIENVFRVLSDFEYVVPRRQFEDTLEKVLESKTEENIIPADNTGKLYIVHLIINLANMMHVDLADIRKHQREIEDMISENHSNEDTQEFMP